MKDAEKHSILIVDDDKNNLFALTAILEKDYTALTTKSGQGGLKIAASRKPDLILLDVIMPDMSGFDVLRELKEDQELKDTPVIFITGLASVEDEAKGFTLGAVDYITKPFHRTIVEVRVKTQIKAVDHRRLIEQSAILDALTGIPNRRSYDAFLKREWDEAIREGKPIGLILADVDHFKQYNDRFGHPKGDDFVASCDRALYAAERAGRNRTSRFEQPPPSPATEFMSRPGEARRK